MHFQPFGLATQRIAEKTKAKSPATPLMSYYYNKISVFFARLILFIFQHQLLMLDCKALLFRAWHQINQLRRSGHT